jgi:hypothetical protein
MRLTGSPEVDFVQICFDLCRLAVREAPRALAATVTQTFLLRHDPDTQL